MDVTPLIFLKQADLLSRQMGMKPGKLLLQYEGLNPSGSFKDNGMTAAFTHALLSPRREYAADRDAASVCNPHDLADALLRLDRAAELVSFAASPATEPLYLVDPFEPDRLSRMFHTHPPLAERVRRLRAIGGASEVRPGDFELPPDA